MGVEPNSFCWVVGELAGNRDGQTWARHFDRLDQLEHAVTDAGSGLLKGLALANQGRLLAADPPIAHTLDVFHTKREGRRAWRATESRLWKAQQKAHDLLSTLEKQSRQGQSLQGKTQRAQAASREAERLLEEAIEIETAWKHVGSALDWFTPEGELNTVEAARAKLDIWLPRLKGKNWNKTVRMLQRPESLAFLDRVGKQLTALLIERRDLQDALRLEAIRRSPSLLAGEDVCSRGLHAWHLVASLRLAKDASLRTAVEQVRQVIRALLACQQLGRGDQQRCSHAASTSSAING